MRDLIIIGGGPSGLSAAINAASEGIETTILERQRFGGQAGSSSLIENFIGFPDGLSGDELTQRSVQQAEKFGVECIVPFNVTKIERDDTNPFFKVYDDNLEVIEGKSILLAMGVQYRSLRAKNLFHFIGNGVSYGSPILANNYNNKTVVIIGGANSAGQAAMYLSKCENCRVILLVRASSIKEKMSEYLTKRIIDNPHIQVVTNSELVSVEGNYTLETATYLEEGVSKTINCDQIYILIGAAPKTKWLGDLVRTDEHGFILGSEETCIPFQASPGLFVAGDIRANSVKRVSNAVGEGARVISSIHQYLSTF